MSVSSYIEGVLVKALKEITKGEGPFNRDPLQHAENCIEEMQATARKALSETKDEGDEI